MEKLKIKITYEGRKPLMDKLMKFMVDFMLTCLMFTEIIDFLKQYLSV